MPGNAITNDPSRTLRPVGVNIGLVVLRGGGGSTVFRHGVVVDCQGVRGRFLNRCATNSGLLGGERNPPPRRRSNHPRRRAGYRAQRVFPRQCMSSTRTSVLYRAFMWYCFEFVYALSLCGVKIHRFPIGSPKECLARVAQIIMTHIQILLELVKDIRVF